MKGIILSAGKGTRLYPLTLSTSKQLLPIYDKPMIYYSLSVLMIAQIKDILIIVNERDLPSFKLLLGDGSHLGINIEYKIQKESYGLPDAFILGENFIEDDNVCLILGDNLFYGNELKHILMKSQKNNGGTIFGYHVPDPERFGVVEFNKNKKILSIEEKPINPKSNYAVTGLYFFDNNAIKFSKELKPSNRGELEITDVMKKYLENGTLNLEILKRGITWSDTGTFESLSLANSLISNIQNIQGCLICCPEEISYRNDWIDKTQLLKLADQYNKNNYGKYLKGLYDGRID